MSVNFKVKESFVVKDKTVISFQKKLSDKELGARYLRINGKDVPFMLTYNEYWVMINGSHDLTGQSISFV